MALVQRKLEFSFALGKGTFGDSGSTNVKLSGLRASAKIIKAGGPSMGTAHLVIYGMKLSLMNQLSTLGMAITLDRRNTVTVTAGDDTTGMGTVFVGTIKNAWADMAAAPDTAFQVEAHTGGIEAVVPATPSSFQGAADVATIMSGLASKMQLSFENNGVNTKLANSYYSGSARDQAMAVAQDAGCEWIIDNGKLAIWPAGSARGSSVPLISKDTGMDGYPQYTSKGILVNTLFNPSLGFGSKVKVQSSLTPACGEWIIYNLEYDLQCYVPNGKWRATFEAARPGFVVVS